MTKQTKTPKSDQLIHKRGIGLAIQPRTYFEQREGSILDKLKKPFTSFVDLLKRGYASRDTQQGVMGALTSGRAGHTMLQSTIDNKESYTTGFTPSGYKNMFKVVMGPHGFMGEKGAKVVGAANVDGAFHNETGIDSDPESISLTADVGPGVHTRFRNLQKELATTELGNGIYSFRPQKGVSKNCASAATGELNEFIEKQKQHRDVMGKLQDAQNRALISGNTILEEVKNGGTPSLSKNQLNEHRNLSILNDHNNKLIKSVNEDQANNSGNQGHVTKIMRGMI